MSRPTVLCVEDNPANRVLVEVLLERHDIEPVIARTGAEALDISRARHLDLILLDLHLPDYTGHEVLARLRADTATSSIPVVILTADLAVDSEAFADDPLTSLLRKPFDRREFDRVISRHTSGDPTRAAMPDPDSGSP